MARAAIMKDNGKLDDVKFWGKIEGLTNTYYILVGLQFNESYEFPHKTFYWA
jgi:radial spoke head protein 9